MKRRACWVRTWHWVIILRNDIKAEIQYINALKCMIAQCSNKSVKAVQQSIYSYQINEMSLTSQSSQYLLCMIKAFLLIAPALFKAKYRAAGIFQALSCNTMMIFNHLINSRLTGSIIRQYAGAYPILHLASNCQYQPPIFKIQ